jgi:hypothetical protein
MNEKLNAETIKLVNQLKDVAFNHGYQQALKDVELQMAKVVDAVVLPELTIPSEPSSR